MISWLWPVNAGYPGRRLHRTPERERLHNFAVVLNATSPESSMATEIHTSSDGKGTSTFLGFLLGAVLVAVGVVGFFMWDNYKSGGGAPQPTAVIKVEKK